MALVLSLFLCLHTFLEIKAANNFSDMEIASIAPTLYPLNLESTNEPTLEPTVEPTIETEIDKNDKALIMLVVIGSIAIICLIIIAIAGSKRKEYEIQEDEYYYVNSPSSDNVQCDEDKHC